MTDLDDRLAEATDELLGTGNMPHLDGEDRPLGSVVNDLYRVIDPTIRPSAASQQRMVARLNQEWDRQHAPPRLRLMDRPMVRLAALAAAVVLVLAAIVVLAVPDTPDQLQGAAIGLGDGAAILVLLAVAAGGAILYRRSRR